MKNKTRWISRIALIIVCIGISYLSAVGVKARIKYKHDTHAKWRKECIEKNTHPENFGCTYPGTKIRVWNDNAIPLPKEKGYNP